MFCCDIFISHRASSVKGICLPGEAEDALVSLKSAPKVHPTYTGISKFVFSGFYLTSMRERFVFLWSGLPFVLVLSDLYVLSTVALSLSVCP